MPDKRYPTGPWNPAMGTRSPPCLLSMISSSLTLLFRPVIIEYKNSPADPLPERSHPCDPPVQRTVADRDRRSRR